MKITVRVFGDLKPILGRERTLEIEEGAKVRALASQISREAGLKRSGFLGKYRLDGGELAILVNGRNIALLDGVETTLRDGDEVILLPPAPGG